MTVREKARAKLNLFLEITGRRQDGYHLLETVMHTVSLCDRVSVTRREGELVAVTEGMDLPSGPENLAWLAAARYLEGNGLERANVYINIKKNIPSGAGMGGGSADAAAVLRAMEKLYGLPIPQDAALSLGADVPFCLAGGCALCTGVGETMKPLPALGLDAVIVMPEQKMQTALAYRLWDSRPHDFAVSSEKIVRAINSALSVNDLLYNTFESVAFECIPECASVKARLQKLGASALMTGSGSAVFGLFEDRKTARAAYRALRKEYPRVFSAKLE